MTPSARSTKYLRGKGCIVARVEQRLPIPGKFVTRDAFGLGDLLAAHPADKWVALVQVTSMSNLAKHETKAHAQPLLREWLTAGGRFLLHGWAKRGPRGERKVWTVTEREINLETTA